MLKAPAMAEKRQSVIRLYLGSILTRVLSSGCD